MERASFCSLVVLAIFAVGLAKADDSKNKSDKGTTHDKATIAKVDSKESTITVKMKDQDGKESEKTFSLAEGTEYLDSHGKAAKIDAFQPGDCVLITEKNGKITELKKGKNHAHATITKVDAKKGTVTLTMKGEDGKKAEKTLQVADGAKYFDNNGKAAKLDAFQQGDRVKITEKDGKISELKECKEHVQATITKVDAKKGTVTVAMKDEKGKKVEKTFYLTEDVEYIDSTGEVATIDVFESGDEVLIIESDGKIDELNKDHKEKKTADKTVGKK